MKALQLNLVLFLIFIICSIGALSIDPKEKVILENKNDIKYSSFLAISENQSYNNEGEIDESDDTTEDYGDALDSEDNEDFEDDNDNLDEDDDLDEDADSDNHDEEDDADNEDSDSDLDEVDSDDVDDAMGYDDDDDEEEDDEDDDSDFAKETERILTS